MATREWLAAAYDKSTFLLVLFFVSGLLLLLLLYTASSLRQYYRLRAFRGPPTTGFSCCWLVKTVASGRAYLDFWDVTRKYGVCGT